jgi:hypothetical protein
MAAMATLVLAEHGEFLGTRRLGAAVRNQIEMLLRAASPVELDFKGVRMSQSFADEALGKLAVALGAEALRSQVKFVHVDAQAAPLLRFVLARRAPELVRPPRKQ